MRVPRRFPGGAVEAAEAKLIVPVLFGPEAELRRVAAADITTMAEVDNSDRTRSAAVSWRS